MLKYYNVECFEELNHRKYKVCGDIANADAIIGLAYGDEELKMGAE